MSEPGKIDVLIVEDNDIDAQTVAMCLRSHPKVGEIRRQENGVKALDFLAEQTFFPDLILLDLAMPMMDGFEFIPAYRMLYDRRKSVRLADIVVLTTSSRGYDYHKAIVRRAATFATKPSSFVELKQLVTSICDLVANKEPLPRSLSTAAA